MPRPITSTQRWIAVATIAILVLCGVAAADGPTLQQRARSLFGVLEPVAPAALDVPAVVLGRQLFWDERLSADGRTSCASCHTIAAWGADERRFSVDARGARTQRHSPTVFNAMKQPSLRWLGDRTDGASQAERSITGSMGLPSADAIVPLLQRFGYREAFRAAFPDDPDPVSSANYGRALAAYQNTLVTPAPFDRYSSGDSHALTAEQQAGLEVFVSTGCATCHNGPLLGGTSFRKFGIATEYWTATGSDPIDSGRYAISQDEADRYVFRTPMLRNVARTAPYFHDGSVATLQEAVQVMAAVQLGRTLSDEDTSRIVAFLDSLTGEIPSHYSSPHAAAE